MDGRTTEYKLYRYKRVGQEKSFQNRVVKSGVHIYKSKLRQVFVSGVVAMKIKFVIFNCSISKRVGVQHDVPQLALEWYIVEGTDLRARFIAPL
jgi:hypothetical protein